MSEIDFGSDDSLMDPNFVLPSSSGRKLKIIEDSNPEIAKKKTCATPNPCWKHFFRLTRCKYMIVFIPVK